MRYIMLLTALLMGACSTEPPPNTAPNQPPPVVPENSQITLAAMDKDGVLVKSTVDGAAYNRLVAARWERMQAYHRGEEIVQQAAVTFLGNAGPGCVYYPPNNCPIDPMTICAQDDATWVYNEHYGWNSTSYTLIVGCFAGPNAWGPLMQTIGFYNPVLGYNSTWGYSVRSAWAGSEEVAFVREDDAQQPPIVPHIARRLSPWSVWDWGSTFYAPHWIVRLYHW
jgi:hypothetical protein